MLQQFIKDWKLHKTSFFTMLAAQIGFFLLGILLVIMVQIIQSVGTKLAQISDKRLRNRS